MDNAKSWKQKSAALTLAVSLVLTNPLALTGCGNKTVPQDKDKEEEQQQAQGGSSYHHSTPFIFNSSNSNNASLKNANQSPKGWQAWTTPNSSGGYSGVHSGSVAG